METGLSVRVRPELHEKRKQVAAKKYEQRLACEEELGKERKDQAGYKNYFRQAVNQHSGRPEIETLLQNSYHPDKENALAKKPKAAKKPTNFITRNRELIKRSMPVETPAVESSAVVEQPRKTSASASAKPEGGRGARSATPTSEPPSPVSSSVFRGDYCESVSGSVSGSVHAPSESARATKVAPVAPASVAESDSKKAARRSSSETGKLVPQAGGPPSESGCKPKKASPKPALEEPPLDTEDSEKVETSAEPAAKDIVLPTTPVANTVSSASSKSVSKAKDKSTSAVTPPEACHPKIVEHLAEARAGTKHVAHPSSQQRSAVFGR